ncbi:MAG: Gfo/Idh/MocA family oxidoreductase [Planctomycetales bacterium]
MSRLQLALIGCGQIGLVHARRLVKDGRAEFRILCDPSPHGAETIRRECFPNANYVSTVAEALAAPGLDGVIIATPTHLHYEQALAALHAGIPTLCEKPLAETRDKIVHLIAEAAKPNAPLFVVGYQRRFWSPYLTLKREIASGRWGKVLAFSLHNSEHWLQLQALPGTWRNDPAQNPGGYLGDAGSHKIDALFYLTGLEPTEVFAYSDNCGANVPITSMITGMLTGNVPLALSFVGNAHHFREDLHIVLEHADLVMADEKLWIARKNELTPLTDLEPDSDATLGFLDILQGKLPNFAPAGCALPVFDFTMAALESARNGRIQKIAHA